MPIYEYQCRSCGTRTEAMQRVSDPPLKTCDDCGGDLKKLISAPAFQFKGSGWYVTDYSGKGGNAEGDGKEASPADSKEKESKKSDTSDSAADKPAKTTETAGPTKSERITSG